MSTPASPPAASLPRPPRPATIVLPERIEGPRVALRPFDVSDGPAVFEAINESRQALLPWMPWAHGGHQTVEDSLEFCARARARWLLREDLTIAMVLRDSGRFLGGTGMHRIDWSARRFEIGYWVRTSAAGKGYVGEATRLLTQTAFEQLGANRVEIRCDSRNFASRRVPESLGFVLEATLRQEALDTSGVLRDTLVFAMIRADYDAARPRWRAKLGER